MTMKSTGAKKNLKRLNLRKISKSFGAQRSTSFLRGLRPIVSDNCRNGNRGAKSAKSALV